MGTLILCVISFILGSKIGTKPIIEFGKKIRDYKAEDK